jgi:hypothetical protein
MVRFNTYFTHTFMIHRGFAVSLGLLALTIAGSAHAAFPEDFDKLREGRSSSSRSSVSESSASSSDSSASSSSSIEITSPEYTMPIADTDAAMPRLADGTIMTRAQFTALVVEKLYSQAELDRCFWDITSPVPPTFEYIFTDVRVGDRYSKHICIAMRDGLISGYRDGSFRPGKQINFSESAKILSKAFSLAPYAEYDRLSPWYGKHVQALADRKAIPTGISRLDQPMSAGNAREMLERLYTKTTWKESRTYQELLPKPPVRPAVSSTHKPTIPKTVTGSSASSVSSSSSSAAVSSSSSKGGSFWNPF